MDTTKLRLIKGNFRWEDATWEWAVLERADGKYLSLRAPAGVTTGADGNDWPTCADVTEQTGWLVTAGAPGSAADERVFRMAESLTPEEAAALVLMMKVAIKYETRLLRDDDGMLRSDEMQLQGATAMADELRKLGAEADAVRSSEGMGKVLVGPPKR